MSTFATVALTWVALSVPVSLVVGRALRGAADRYPVVKQSATGPHR